VGKHYRRGIIRRFPFRGPTDTRLGESKVANREHSWDYEGHDLIARCAGDERKTRYVLKKKTASRKRTTHIKNRLEERASARPDRE